MSVEVTWDESDHAPEKSVIRWHFGESWNWHQFLEADQQSFDMTQAVDHPVDILIDFRSNQQMPRSGALAYFTRSVRRKSPNRGLVVLVQPPPLMRALESVMRRLNPQFSTGFVSVKTLDEAYEKIAQRRAQSV